MRSEGSFAGRNRALLAFWFVTVLALLGLHALHATRHEGTLSAHALLDIAITSVLGVLGPCLLLVLRQSDRRNLQTRLEVAFDRLETGILTADDGGRVRYVNPALTRMMKLGEKSFVGRHPEEFLPEDATAVYLRERARRKEGVYEPYRLRAERGDGEDIWLQIVPAPLISGRGELLATLVIVQDVTEETRAAELRVELEDQLRRVQRLEALGTLAGGIAHDFNNIFFAILGHAEMAEESAGETPMRTDLAQIRKAGERGRELVTQMLTFARTSDRERALMDISPLVKEGAKLLASSAPMGVRVESRIRSEGLLALTHPAAIHQVLINLVTNALQAVGPEGRITIGLSATRPRAEECRARPSLAGKDCLRLEIVDDGEGISPDDVERLFEPFFTTREIGVGSGMGLAVVHGIVEEHEGVVFVESTPGSGSTFTVLLPAQRAEMLEHEEDEIDVTGRPARILLIDDEITLVRLMSSMLESAGHAVTSYSSPVDGMRAYLESPHDFDLLITDQAMPILSGEDLVSAIREEGYDVPVILATGSTPRPDAQRLADLRISACITKPMTLRELRDGVARAMNEEHAACELTGGVR